MVLDFLESERLFALLVSALAPLASAKPKKAAEKAIQPP